MPKIFAFITFLLLVSTHADACHQYLSARSLTVKHRFLKELIFGSMNLEIQIKVNGKELPWMNAVPVTLTQKNIGKKILIDPTYSAPIEVKNPKDVALEMNLYHKNWFGKSLINSEYGTFSIDDLKANKAIKESEQKIAVTTPYWDRQYISGLKGKQFGFGYSEVAELELVYVDGCDARNADLFDTVFGALRVDSE